MKYIIEIEDVPFSKVRIDADNGAQNINLYRAKGFNALVFDEHGLDKLTPLDKALEEAYQKGVHDGSIDVKERVDVAYQKGFEAGQHEATTLEYQQGLDDAWKAITKIAKMPDGERMTHFGEVWISNILNAYSLEQIFTILEKSESESDEIKVGDELCFVFAGGETIEPFIVFSIKDDNGKKYYEGIQVSDGRWVGGGLKYYKTGRHFQQVAELLEAMKEGAE